MSSFVRSLVPSSRRHLFVLSSLALSYSVPNVAAQTVTYPSSVLGDIKTEEKSKSMRRPDAQTVDQAIVPFTDPACFIEEYAGLLGAFYDTEEFDREKSKTIISEFLGPMGLELEVAKLLYLSRRELVPLLALEESVPEDVYRLFERRVREKCGGTRMLGVEDVSEEDKPAEAGEEDVEEDTTLTEKKRSVLRKLQDGVPPPCDKQGEAVADASNNAPTEYTADEPAEAPARRMRGEGKSIRRYLQDESLSVEVALKEKKSESGNESEKETVGTINEEAAPVSVKGEAMVKDGGSEAKAPEDDSSSTATSTERKEEGMKKPEQALDLSLMQEPVQQLQDALTSVISPQALSDAVKMVQQHGGEQAQKFLEDALTGSLDGAGDGLSRFLSIFAGRTRKVEEGASVRQVVPRTFEPRDCSFIATSDPACFIVEYGGFVGRSWGTEPFDRNLAQFVVDNFLTTPQLASAAATLMCLTADVLMLELEGGEAIDAEGNFLDGDAIDGFFEVVPGTCQLPSESLKEAEAFTPNVVEKEGVEEEQVLLPNVGLGVVQEPVKQLQDALTSVISRAALSNVLDTLRSNADGRTQKFLDETMVAGTLGDAGKVVTQLLNHFTERSREDQ